MIADLTRHRLGQTEATDGPQLLDDAAVIWAVLNAIEVEDFEGEDVQTINTVKAWFFEQLKSQGISQTALFEHIRCAIESNDLGRFGASPGPGDQPPSAPSPPKRDRSLGDPV